MRNVWLPTALAVEGMLLHLDPRASKAGFPDIVTLPVSGGGEPSHWTWAGETYRIFEAEKAAGDGGAARKDP